MDFEADSHDLARVDREIKGEAQKRPILESGAELTDLGWHKNLADMPGTLIAGVTNESLFAMIRRFNKDVFDVQAVPLVATTGLDLTEAWDDDHSTDKITLHLQRFYLSIFLGLTSFGKQISRLRSWKDANRTAAFCVTYFSAWVFNFLIPLSLGMLLVIVASERARNVLFPSAPRALVNISTGGLQKPQSGQLGSIDTLTGAPEKAEGEAREEEAANFVDNLRHIIARAVGMHENKNSEGDPLEGKVPKPIRKAIRSVKAAGSAPGHATGESGKDMTQKPMEELLWDKAKPKVIEPVVKNTPHVIGEIVDNWERFAHAISPTPPFSRLSFLRIEAVLMPLFLASLFVPQRIVYKGTGLAVGFGLFGEPIISRFLTLLNGKFPSWMEMLEPKNNILRGVPTNNQLTLTLLRIGEAHHSPLPPVPSTTSTDSNSLPNIHIDQVPLNASHREIIRAVEPSPMLNGSGDDSSSPENASEGESEKPTKHRHLSKFLTYLKGNTKATVQSKLAIDHVRAAAGSSKAQGHLGVLPEKKNLIYAGPAEFKARFNGEKGWLYISNTSASAITNSASTEPRLLFITEDPRNQHSKIDASDTSTTLWSMKLKDIHRLKRATAFMGKLAEKAANWSEDTELLSSLEIDDEKGETWRFTAIPERDALFNRLIAVGEQRWENM
ncbi:hypothetical protein N431DRAFT_391269 [Stipitochalara longipes BDJ]|nr:hypothetical protein N431DRAFT_391269 [Stipitochalara longipes BDJ]